MKLNVINVLNEIASEEATVILLNDPEAFWNWSSNESEVREDYKRYKHDTEYDNSDTWDLIEYEEKHGRDYTPWLKYLKKVLSFEEWLAEEKALRAKYMVSSACNNCPFNYCVNDNIVNKMLNTVNNNNREAAEFFVKILVA